MIGRYALASVSAPTTGSNDLWLICSDPKNQSGQSTSILVAWSGRLLIGTICLALFLAVVGCGNRSATPNATNSAESKPIENSESAAIPKDNRASQASESAVVSDALNSNESTITNAPNEVNVISTIDPLSPAELLAAGSWTVQRFIVLAEQGPLVIDLHSQVGSVDLDTALRANVAKVCDELMRELGEAVSWEEVLQSELIRSGWLGPLLSRDDQIPNIIQTYDVNQNSIAESDEMVEFVSLGAAQQDTLSFRDESASTARSMQSPWGPLDRDEDHSLDLQEIASAADTLFDLDFDGDANISLAEINPISEAGAMMSGRRAQSMLPVETVIFESRRSKSNDEAKMTRNRQNLASKILQHYTYLESIERDQWSSCPGRLWDSLDTSRDGKLDSRELSEIFVVDPNCRLLLRLEPTPQQPSDSSHEGTQSGESSDSSKSMKDRSTTVQWVFDKGDFAEFSQWSSSGTGMRVLIPGLNLQILFDETLPPAMNSLLAAQLNAGLQNAQIRAAIAAQLQLSESAFDLIDEDGDEKLSESEFQKVLGWIRCRQSTRLQAVWAMSQNPWFQFLDQDMNQRISEWEISQVGSLLSTLESLTNSTVEQGGAASEQQKQQHEISTGPVSADRLPTIATIRIRQGDERFAIPENQLAVSGAQNTTPSDWFSAMDSNGDSTISRAEFLGNRTQFEQIDLDGNGFISRTETLQYVQK